LFLSISKFSEEPPEACAEIQKILEREYKILVEIWDLENYRACPDLEEFDNIILASGIENGKWTTNTRKFLTKDLKDKNIAVGPSAPPIIPIAPASGAANPRYNAPINVAKIPICAAAPKSINLGLDINDEKSVIAPIPKKINEGYQP